jgi:hypothetical protein
VVLFGYEKRDVIDATSQPELPVKSTWGGILSIDRQTGKGTPGSALVFCCGIVAPEKCTHRKNRYNGCEPKLSIWVEFQAGQAGL